MKKKKFIYKFIPLISKEAKQKQQEDQALKAQVEAMKRSYLDRLTNASAAERESAVDEILGKHDRDLETLKAAIKQSDTATSIDLVKLMGRMGDRQASGFLLRMFESSSYVDLRLAALWALSRLAAPDLDSALQGAVVDKDPQLRAYAAHILGIVGEGAALKPLQRLLRDDVAAVRQQACLSLTYFKDKQADRALKTAFHDPKPVISELARLRLRERGYRYSVTHPLLLKAVHAAILLWAAYAVLLWLNF
ncbi:MAG: HEAT repeat domain-containing protein [Elusimicrobiota bacterium]